MRQHRVGERVTATGERAHYQTDPEEAALVAALRRGDDDAFMRLVERYHTGLVRLAAGFVADRATAEEVVQETWLAVLQGLDRFEGRSSLRTWISRILVNRARTRAVRERRTIPFSALVGEEEGPTVDPARFVPDGRPGAGEWASPPRPWEERPEERVLAAEVGAVVAAALDTLPPRQRTVITLRDVEGWPAEEVRDLLDLSEGNQRVLLHRARAKVRRELERYFDGL